MPNNSLPIKNSVVILDTCILQYLNKKEIRPILFGLFKILEKNNNILRVSDITTFELFSECPKEREKKLLEIWRGFPRYKVDPKVTMAAARLSTLYRFEDNIEHSRISVGDKIIGATAYLTGSYILTANSNDFPRPFFSEKHIERVIYKKKNKEKIIHFYFLRAEYPIINHRLESRP